MTALPTDRTFFQNAWVVDDVEAAMRRWTETLGVGPFFVGDYTALLTDTTYRGKPSPLSMKIAIAQAGPVQIELIEPTTDGPTAYRDTVPAGREAFHHMCTWSHDWDADQAYYESRGCPLVSAGRLAHNGMRFGYFDTTAQLGCMVELFEWHQAGADGFAGIAEAAQGWDGSEPVRWVT
jgi:hypothetical protein